jgi:hypothetical protein
MAVNTLEDSNVLIVKNMTETDVLLIAEAAIVGFLTLVLRIMRLCNSSSFDTTLVMTLTQYVILKDGD